MRVLSPVKLTLIKTKKQFFLSDQIVVIFRHGLVISFNSHDDGFLDYPAQLYVRRHSLTGCVIYDKRLIFYHKSHNQ